MLEISNGLICNMAMVYMTMKVQTQMGVLGMPTVGKMHGFRHNNNEFFIVVITKN